MTYHAVQFGPVLDAGAGRVNIQVRLMAELPTVDYQKHAVVSKEQCILSFYANIDARINGSMKIDAIKQLIEEDWGNFVCGAVEIAKRYMIN